MSEMYFELLPGTDAYNMARLIFEYHKDWNKEEVEKDLKSVLGVDINKNLSMDPNNLVLKTIPEGTRDQFKKLRTNAGQYVAKVSSELGKKYLEIIKKHNLKSYSIMDLIPIFKSFDIPALCPIKTKSEFRFFFKIEDDKRYSYDIEKVITNFKKDARLKETKKSEYLQLKVEMAKYYENIDVNK